MSLQTKFITLENPLVARTVNNYFRMPPLYQMDDYDRCFGENPPTDEKVVYCFARSQIQPNESSEVWDIIQVSYITFTINANKTRHFRQNFSADHKRHFRHDRLVRGVCLHWCKPHYHNYVPSAKRRYLVTPFDNTSEVEFKHTFDWLLYTLNQYVLFQSNRLPTIRTRSRAACSIASSTTNGPISV